ncbi:fibrinogen-binding protein [Staphylococcus agnetis]|uniref:fibrinogen-binding protein n=1 Tax=Staphylococcus agnetis TaxID=985762 RepID=UPI000D040851|nr:fibrinogen-binding protein [Staphylococcus agnetis]MCO4338302.1 fibrinogen-binding protein [Staphylococcus agnetis]MCO4341388.1 fibrinogen-binding protein [Staphylococcus agnetis]MCO4343375.1 fibrinogen-binding protein [Staphylococcus agnetis]MCO4348453.1 fibrinogen-binding protein [Staphylococcus agnetis]MCO4353398.1 fibrinogen-binding protein [Staphylococcus agnetis]
MKNKFIAKSLLTLSVLGVTVTGISSSAEASGLYGPREKKPIAIKNNIVEYSDGTYKYQSRPKFNKTPIYIKFRHANNIVEYNDGTFSYGPRPVLKKTQAKTLEASMAALNAKLKNAKNLVAEFEQKRTIKTHRAAQRAVNILPSEAAVSTDKKILQDRINKVLKQGPVK